MVRHEFNGIEYGYVRRNRNDLALLRIKQVFHQFHTYPLGRLSRLSPLILAAGGNLGHTAAARTHFCKKNQKLKLGGP